MKGKTKAGLFFNINIGIYINISLIFILFLVFTLKQQRPKILLNIFFTNKILS
jgi:hypothetical protein